jgi:hypothetical protein
VVNSSGDHMRRGPSIVAAGIAVDSLPFVAPMVDAVFAATRLEHLVRQRGPALPRVLTAYTTGTKPAQRRKTGTAIRRTPTPQVL